MYLMYLAVIGTLALKNVASYASSPQRRVSIADNILADNFPEVEYPSSIMDSTKPFYLNVSPFSSDVKSSFQSLASTTSAKPKSTTFDFKFKDDGKEKSKGKSVTSQNTAINEKGKNITNVKDKNATVFKEPTKTEFKVTTGRQIPAKATNNESLAEESTDKEDMEFVLSFIDDLDEFITTLTDFETEFLDLNNSTTNTFEEERLNEFTTMPPDMTSDDNDNNSSTHSEASPFERSEESSSIVASFINEGIKNPIFCNDAQNKFDNGTVIANDNNESVTAQ